MLIFLLENFENFIDNNKNRWLITDQEFQLIHTLIEQHKYEELESYNDEDSMKWVDYEKDHELSN
jgi:hypothetical protein